MTTSPSENPQSSGSQSSRPGTRPPAALSDARAQQRRLETAYSRGSGMNAIAGSIIALIWAVALVYLLFTPSIYLSRWSMILPTANSGSSVTLETIGQASTTPSQPFGSMQASPKVIYREIAASDQIRRRAAASLGMTHIEFGRVRIKLIDETSLLMFQITGTTAEEAQAKGRALIEALEYQLDQLRKDEQERRSKIVRDNLKLYQANLDTARERILDFQRQTGLQSLNQFNEASSSAELLRRKIADVRSEIDRLSAEQLRLMERIGIEPTAAAAGLRLAADPAFVRLSTAFAESASSVYETGRVLGPNHPARGLAKAKGDSAYAEMVRIARSVDIAPSVDLRALLFLMNGSQQSELMRSIVANEAILNGRRNELKSVETELGRLEVEVSRLGEHASRLEALKKDHLVAEAVFTSAMARLDTNRGDLYSSYPLMQVLAAPELPENRSQPRLAYAIVAGLLGTFLVMLAWGAAWVGGKFSRRR